MKLVKRAIKVNSWAWILILSLVLVMFYVTFVLPESEAITRDEVNDLESEINDADERIILFDEKIDDQHELISEYTIDIKNEKENVRQIKRNSTSSWDRIELVYEAEELLYAAQSSYQSARDKLFSILTEKSNYIKSIKLLETQLTQDRKSLKSFDYSNQTKRIGIQLDKTCETIIRAGLESVCPSIKDLVILDSSDTSISGKFTTDDNGFFHRGKPPVEKSWRFYDTDDKIRLFVDPPKGMAERIKMITIQPNFDNYFLQSDKTLETKFEIVNATHLLKYGNQTKAISYTFLNQTQDYSRIIYHDWYIDSCKNGKINAVTWLISLPKVLYELRNGCPSEFSGEREVITPNYTTIDVTTSPNWQYQQKLIADKERCKGLCFEY